jgi:hypothetical protein
MPHFISFHAPKSSKNSTRKPSNNTIDITHIPNHYDQHSIHSPNKANKWYHLQQIIHNLHKAKTTLKHSNLQENTCRKLETSNPGCQEKNEDGGRGAKVYSFVDELPYLVAMINEFKKL